MAYDILNNPALMSEGREQKMIFRSEPLLGGLVSFVGPQYLDDKQASLLENAVLADPSRPEVRDGYALIGSAQTNIDAGLLAKRISSIGVLSPTGTTASKMFITIADGASGRTYRDTDTASGWTEATVAGPATYDAGTASDVPTAQLDDCYYILGSTPAAFATGAEPSGTISTNADDVALTGGCPTHSGVDICYYLGRGWILDSNCYLHYSKFQPSASTIITDWARTGTLSDTTLAGRLQLSPNATQVARGLLPWNDGYLLAFFDSSIEAVFLGASPVAGSVPGITDPFSYSLREVVEPRFGLIARRAKAVLGKQAYYMDQYGNVRALSQTISGTQSGTVPLPLSEPIRDELPGKLNFGAADKVWFALEGNELHVYYPRDGAVQCNARAVFNLSYGIWQSIDVFPVTHGCGVVSDIRGAGKYELFTANGNSTGTLASKVYRWKTGSYTDDGEPIVYTEYSKALTYGAPECEKLFPAMEAGFIGDAGVVVSVTAQVDEDGRTVTVDPEYEIPVTAASDFPVVDADFPITDADFPFADGSVGITRNLWRLDNLLGGQMGRGRMIRFGFQFSTTSDGLWAQRAEWWATARPLPRKEME